VTSIRSTEDQLVVRTSASTTPALVAAADEQRTLVSGDSRVGELGDELGEVVLGDPVKTGWDRAARAHVGMVMDC
jgi:hypothetical protein